MAGQRRWVFIRVSRMKMVRKVWRIRSKSMTRDWMLVEGAAWC